jgi:hypothetical protein
MVLDASQGGGGYLPPDLQLTNEEAAKAAASTSASSYTKTIDLPLVKYKKYKFQASYLYLDEKTNSQIEGNRSPWLETTFDIPNNTKPVINLVLTQGIKSYGVKFDFQAGSEHEDVIVYESLTGAFAGEQYIVYVGTANSMTINTSDFANRWVKVVTRDRWLDTNISSATAGPVKPLNADPDTSTAPSAPSYAQVVGSIDADDKSGFSGKITASWTANTDTNTSGYVIRWTTQNPATTQNPIWEYGQVEGKATTTFSVTGLLPNTLYYYQVTAKSPYNALSWASPQSGTFGPIVDSTAPADAYAQLKSIISIGGKTADLFKIGTGIAQSINTSTTSTPSLVSGTYNGIVLNKSTTNYGHNYWLNTGQFRVGSSSAFLFWDGSDLYTTGKINATGGVFSGDVGITNGSIYAGSSPTSGARVRMNTGGFFAYDTDGVQTISISTVDGKIDARKGYVGGWTIDGTAQTTGSIYSSNTKLESSGNLTLGDTSGTLASIVRLSASDSAYRLWVGSQTAANAPFRVTKEGKLYATGAVFGTGSTIDGYATTATVSGISTRLTTVEGAYVSSTTLSTGLATKNTTFVQGTTPTAVKTGDLWIDTANGNELKTWTGTVWTSRRDTTFAKSTDLASKLNANAYIIQSAVDNKISADATGFEIYAGSSSTTSSGVKITSAGILGYKGGNPTFTITSAGDATFYGNLSGATGTFTGRLTAGANTDSTGYIDTQGSKTVNGTAITSLVVRAMGFNSTTNSGWTTTIYPWLDNAFNLGSSGYSWNNLYLGTAAYFAGGTTYKVDSAGDATLNGYAVTGGYGVFSNWSPRTDAGQTLGLSTRRWGTIYSNSSTISTSDRNLKTEITESDLGLDFIKKIQPVSYKWKIGNVEEVFETKQVDHYGKDDGIEKTEEVLVPKVIGQDENGKDIIETVTRPGIRTHYGIIAQQVKEVLDEYYDGKDFAGWVAEDPDNLESLQSLRYEEFISPLIKAVQELSDMVESLQQEVNTLKGI